MNNTKLKELGLWVEPSADIIAIRAERKRLHRLFNPKKIKRIPSEETLAYRELRRIIRSFKHKNLITGRKIVNDPKWRPNIIPRKPKKLHPKLIKLLPSKPSLFVQNTNILKEHGYVPKKTKPNTYICIRFSNKEKVKIPEIWSEEEHRWYRPKPVNVKKEKKLSPYWAKKLAS